MEVCIVEDDARLAAVLQQAIEEDGSVAIHLSSGDHAASYIASHPFDVVVLDLMLPGVSGLVVIQEMRSAKCQTPVLVLSARDTVPEMVRALDLGADDYMTKPFHVELFLARLRSISRRGVIPHSTGLMVGPLALHPAQRLVIVDGVPLDLTRREYMLLETLVRRAGRVVTREQLADAVWGLAADVSKSNLDYHMHSLRTKLGPSCEGMVRTVRGVGYMVQSEARVA